VEGKIKMDTQFYTDKAIINREEFYQVMDKMYAALLKSATNTLNESKTEQFILEMKLVVKEQYENDELEQLIPSPPEPPQPKWIEKTWGIQHGPYCNKCGSTLQKEKWHSLRRTKCPNQCSQEIIK
jgi:hypothetical protein